MEGVVADLGKTFSERLIDGVIEKSRYIFCFKCIVEEFEKEKAKLEAERTTVRQKIRVATEKDKDIKFNAQFWEKQVDKLIQEDTKTKKRCFFGIFPDCIWRYRRGEELTTKIDEIQKWMEKGEKLENIELARHRPDVERYSSQYFISFESRELIYNELLEALRDESSYITGLYGMGGTGKTTLAREVGKKIKTLEKFDHVIDTTVSSTPDIKKIQDDISGSLGLELEGINESDRPKTLWSRLTNGEKILVILDDVWGSLDFHNIGIPNSDNHKGCKVLLVTRNLQVCNKMVSGKKIHMDLVTEKEAWDMFKMFADLSNISSKKILNKGREIATKCKRLPVAIATIACSLKGQTRLEEWDAALNLMHMPVAMHDVDDDSIDIYKCLKFSYDYLKNEKTKKLFRLCSLFQEDEEISIEILTKFAIGAGLFGEDYGSYKNARSQVVKAKNKLLESCLLLETENGDVKMHDLVREVAQWIANKEIQIVNFSNKDQKSMVQRDKRIKYLSCEGHLKDLFSSKFYGSKLEILIVNMNMKRIVDFPISFFENMSELRVLSLVDKSYRGPTLALPQSILSLTNIRSLFFKRVCLGDISILGSLKSLETLDLYLCEIDELPHEITKLEKFRLLNLYSCTIKRNNPFEVIQKCQSLEELYLHNSFNDFCLEITLPSLQRYHVLDGFDIKNNSLSKIVSVQKYQLSGAGYKDIMQTTEILQLVGTGKRWRNLIPEHVPIDQGMNDLIELILHYDSHLQLLVETEHNDSQEPTVFSNLVALELVGMENMEELCNGTISSDSFKNLEKLFIKKCNHLRSLFKCSLNLGYLKTMTLKSCSTLVSIFDMSTSRSLVLLEKLKIIDCEQLENIFTYERRGNDTIEEILVDGNNDSNKKISCNSMFPNLKVVDIKMCSRLQSIFPLLSVDKNIFLAVEPIKSIFKPQTQLAAKPIKSNRFSWSRMCCSEDQPQDRSISKDLSGNYLEPHLGFDEINGQQKNLGRLQKIELYGSATMTYLFVGPRNCFSLQNLLSIEITRCEKLEIIFPTCVLKCLPQLVDVIITECHELKYIIEDDENNEISNDMSPIRTCFPKLETLVVVNCDKLKYIFPASICSELPELWFLVVTEADKLEKIFGGSEEDDQRVEFPKLNAVALFALPSLGEVQINQFQTVEHRLVTKKHRLQKHSLLEASPNFFKRLASNIGESLYEYLELSLTGYLVGDTKTQETSGGNLNGTDQVESSTSRYESNEFEIDSGLEIIPSVALFPTNSKELMNDPPMIFFGPKQKGEEGSTVTNVSTITSSTHLELVSSSQELMNDPLMNDPPIIIFGPKQKGGEGSTVTNVNTITSSTHLELVSSSQHQDADVRDSQESTKTNIDQVSLNDVASKKVTLILEEQFPKDDFRDLESKPTPSNHIYFPSMPPSEGNASQIMKNSSSPSINVIWELEQLVSENYLDYENLSLLTDFLVKYPSVLLKDSSLSNRYKGYAYICLAELLQFLQTHSVLDVLGSKRSKFVKLLQDVRSFAFDKDWLDSVERRALFPDIQVSQDALQKLVESKQQVSKEVEVLRSKIDIFNQHVEDLKHQLTSSEAVLESIIQQEAHFLETKVALSAPLGY